MFSIIYQSYVILYCLVIAFKGGKIRYYRLWHFVNTYNSAHVRVHLLYVLPCSLLFLFATYVLLLIFLLCSGFCVRVKICKLCLGNATCHVIMTLHSHVILLHSHVTQIRCRGLIACQVCCSVCTELNCYIYESLNIERRTSITATVVMKYYI